MSKLMLNFLIIILSELTQEHFIAMRWTNKSVAYVYYRHDGELFQWISVYMYLKVCRLMTNISFTSMIL